MRKLRIIFIGICVLAGGTINASPENYDIFGVDDKTKMKISEACSDLMSEHMSFISKLFVSPNQPSNKDLVKKENLEQQIIGKAKQFGQFSQAKVSTIYYPMDKKTYATLDLVDSNDKHRFPRQKSSRPSKVIKQSKELKKLFSLWDAYLNRKFDLIRNNQLDFRNSSCPVSHCIWGFDQQELKDTLPKLQQGLKTHTQTLKEIIKYDKDDQKRENAVFILANDNDYQELAAFLINFTDDPSGGVRNNAMRVIGDIANKHFIKGLNIHRIITALNYPFVTDRNKAASVLYGIVKKDPASHQLVINQAGKILIKLLKLKQPNNHDIAYLILKEISNQSYDEHDYGRWERWIRSHQNISTVS